MISREDRFQLKIPVLFSRLVSSLNFGVSDCSSCSDKLEIVLNRIKDGQGFGTGAIPVLHSYRWYTQSARNSRETQLESRSVSTISSDLIISLYSVPSLNILTHQKSKKFAPRVHQEWVARSSSSFILRMDKTKKSKLMKKSMLERC